MSENPPAEGSALVHAQTLLTEIGHGFESDRPGFSDERLQTWIRGVDERRRVLEDKTLGMIRWHKSLGRPENTLSAGFIVDHRYLKAEWVGTAAGPHLIETWEWADAPVLWDGEDQDNYHVGFLCEPTPIWQNQITVAFANHPWHRESPNFGHRSITPPQENFVPKMGELILLDFEVVASLLLVERLSLRVRG